VKVEIKEISQVVSELTLTVEADKVNKDYKKALQKVSKMAPPIPGFRKGKAPLSAVEKNYGEYVKEELYRDGVDKYLKEAIEENDIKSISEFYPMSYEWNKGEDLVAVFKYEVNPEIKLENVDGIQVPFKAKTIDDAVDEYLAEMKSKNSQMVEVADAVQNNDSAEFELTFTHEGEEKVEVVTVPISQDQEDHSAIVDDAIGKKIGDKFSSEIAAYSIQSVKLKDGNAKVEVNAMVNSIQRLQEPEIDDAFAKSLDYDNIIAMRTSLAQELALKNEKANQNELNKKLMESIINENDFQVPNIIVANEAYRQAKMYMQGKEPDEQMIKILSQIVTPQVKEIYIYEALRKEYALEITEEQVNTLVESLAGLEELTVEEFKEEHKDLFEDDRIKDEAMFEQIFADLAKRVKIVDPEVFAQEKEAKLKAKKEAKDAAEKAKKAEKTEE
jgi:trigger factor